MMRISLKLNFLPFPTRRQLSRLAMLVLASQMLGVGGADAQSRRSPQSVELMRNQQEQGRVPWQLYFTPSCPDSAATCDGVIREIPPGTRVEIRNVSCLIRMNTTSARVWEFRISASGVLDFFAPISTGQGNHVFNNQTLLFANPGDTLFFSTEGSGIFDAIACKLAGERVILR